MPNHLLKSCPMGNLPPSLSCNKNYFAKKHCKYVQKYVQYLMTNHKIFHVTVTLKIKVVIAVAEELENSTRNIHYLAKMQLSCYCILKKAEPGQKRLKFIDCSSYKAAWSSG